MFCGVAARFPMAVVALGALFVGTGPSMAGEPGLRRFGAAVDIAANGQESLLAAGAKVAVKGAVARNATLFGGAVDVDVTLGNDLFVVAGSANVAGTVAGDMELWVGQGVVRAGIGDDLVVRGGSVEVAAESRIADEIQLSTTESLFQGEAIGEVRIEGEDITFAGKAGRNVELAGNRVRILAGAQIDGDLTIYSAEEPMLEQGIVIRGKLEQRSLKEWETQRDDGPMGPIARLVNALVDGEGGWLTRMMVAALAGASALVAGLFMMVFGRGSIEQTIDDLIDHPGSSVLYGLAVVVGVPLATIVLMFTVFGAPVGIFSLLALPLFGLLGYASAGFSVGEWLLNRAGEPVSQGGRALLLLAGLAVLVLLSMIPYVGLLIIAVAALAGLGALIRTLHERLQGRSPL